MRSARYGGPRMAAPWRRVLWLLVLLAALAGLALQLVVLQMGWPGAPPDAQQQQRWILGLFSSSAAAAAAAAAAANGGGMYGEEDWVTALIDHPSSPLCPEGPGRPLPYASESVPAVLGRRPSSPSPWWSYRIV